MDAYADETDRTAVGIILTRQRLDAHPRHRGVVETDVAQVESRGTDGQTADTISPAFGHDIANRVGLTWSANNQTGIFRVAGLLFAQESKIQVFHEEIVVEIRRPSVKRVVSVDAAKNILLNARRHLNATAAGRTTSGQLTSQVQLLGPKNNRIGHEVCSVRKEQFKR